MSLLYRHTLAIIPVLTCVLLNFSGCKKRQVPHAIDEDSIFRERRSLGVVSDNLLNEISGIVASRRYPGYFWVHNDSGGEPVIYLIDSTAARIAQVTVEGLRNRDWEDIAIGPGESGGYDLLYIAETGDNRAAYDSYYIYSFEEPGVDLKNSTQRLFIDDFTTYSYRYPDGPRDAETLLVDPLNDDIFIVSKREPQVHIYRFPAEKRGAAFVTVEKIGKLPFHEIVAGEISYPGNELLLKNYLSVFYWVRKEGESWADVLADEPVVLHYSPEPQGEAIAFTFKTDGFVTLSEAKNFAGKQHLYFYERTSEIDSTLINLIELP